MEIALIGGENDDEGEIVILGPQLAEGYWGDPEQTARAFRVQARETGPQRAYFTGDWAERRSGSIYFRNRIDFQVKVSGYRLELDEVAAAIRALGWTEVVVAQTPGGIVAVIEAAEDADFDETTLQRELAGKLERHALPTRIRRLPSFPRNANDKIDRAAVLEAFCP